MGESFACHVRGLHLVYCSLFIVESWSFWGINGDVLDFFVDWQHAKKQTQL
jgi:hypothetical protein